MVDNDGEPQTAERCFPSASACPWSSWMTDPILKLQDFLGALILTIDLEQHFLNPIHAFTTRYKTEDLHGRGGTGLLPRPPPKVHNDELVHSLNGKSNPNSSVL